MVTAQPAPPTGTFTEAQAVAGRTVYEVSCSGCHMPNLSGRGEAPPLAGSQFITGWGNRTTRDLVTFVQASMPPVNPGSLADADYVNVAAFILQSNGGTAGGQPLTSSANTIIRRIATGGTTLATDSGPAAASGRGGRGGRGAALAPARGLTVTGQVNNYVPVTEEMLRHPDAGDWLMIRRNYQAWSNSPLSQITTANVKNLQLQWVWAMDESGANEPTPIVHNGTMFLANTSNIVQALDAPHRRSDLAEPGRADRSVGGTIAMRSLALYQDKVFVSTTDAHMVALNAATGKLFGTRRSRRRRKTSPPPADPSSSTAK